MPKRYMLSETRKLHYYYRPSPDGRRVVMSLAQAGNSDIYTMDLHTREVRRLTNNPSIDTSPAYSPDGNQLLFVREGMRWWRKGYRGAAAGHRGV
mgnify:CR=1 FL=1